MVKLIAYQAFEGAGILEEDNKLLYIDFPYAKKNELPITHAQVERLIHRMDFVASDLEFKDGKAAIQHLRDLANQGSDPFEEESEASILEKFNSLGVKNLSGIVDSIRTKYVDTHQYGRAIKGLARLKDLPAVQEDSLLRLKVTELLLACNQEIVEAYAFKRHARGTATPDGRSTVPFVDDKFPTLNGSSHRSMLSLQASFQKFV